MSLILLALGVYILARFTLRGIDRRHLGKPVRKRFLGPLGLIAGFVDATGGGGWARSAPRPCWPAGGWSPGG
jgi:hypothetical protein